VTSAAAANIELAIDRGVLLSDMLEIAGVLRWNVTRMGWRCPTGAPPINRVFCASIGVTVELADPVDDVALPTVCAIVARLPSRASNTVILIKFCMIRS